MKSNKPNILRRGPEGAIAHQIKLHCVVACRRAKYDHILTEHLGADVYAFRIDPFAILALEAEATLTGNAPRNARRNIIEHSATRCVFVALDMRIKRRIQMQLQREFSCQPEVLAKTEVITLEELQQNSINL